MTNIRYAFWGLKMPKQTPLNVFDNFQPYLTNVQPIWSSWMRLQPKKDHFEPKKAGFGRFWDPPVTFYGGPKGLNRPPGCVWQCSTLFNKGPTHLEPLEVPMAENGHYWQNRALFGASGAPRCHFLGTLRAQTGHPGCVWQILIPKHMWKSKIGLLEQIWGQNPYGAFFLGHPVYILHPVGLPYKVILHLVKNK